MTTVVRLKAGREKAVQNRHPWIFGGAIDRVRGKGVPGGIVDVVSRGGDWLARGYLNRESQIAVRY